MCSAGVTALTLIVKIFKRVFGASILAGAGLQAAPPNRSFSLPAPLGHH